MTVKILAGPSLTSWDQAIDIGASYLLLVMDLSNFPNTPYGLFFVSVQSLLSVSDNFACFSPGEPLSPLSMEVTEDSTIVPSWISIGFLVSISEMTCPSAP